MSGGTNHCMLELLYLCFEWDNNFLGGGKAKKKPLKCIQAKIRFGGVICLEVLVRMTRYTYVIYLYIYTPKGFCPEVTALIKR